MRTSAEIPEDWRMRPEERNGWIPETVSAADLMAAKLPPVRWVVLGVLPEGVTLLAGKPKLGKSWLVLGMCLAVAAGGVGLQQKLDENLKSVKMRDTLKVMRREIKKYIGPELRESTQQHAAYPQQGYHQPPQAVLLFVGVLDGEPWILLIEKDNTDTVYGDDLGNFAAVGSGELLARALFRPHLETPRDLELEKLFTYRVLDDVIELSCGGVARPIHIHTMAVDGTTSRVESAELTHLSGLCEGWRQL